MTCGLWFSEFDDFAWKSGGYEKRFNARGLIRVVYFQAVDIWAKSSGLDGCFAGSASAFPSYITSCKLMRLWSSVFESNRIRVNTVGERLSISSLPPIRTFMYILLRLKNCISVPALAHELHLPKICGCSSANCTPAAQCHNFAATT